jgi:hypothetical protein
MVTRTLTSACSGWHLALLGPPLKLALGFEDNPRGGRGQSGSPSGELFGDPSGDEKAVVRLQHHYGPARTLQPRYG